MMSKWIWNFERYTAEFWEGLFACYDTEPLNDGATQLESLQLARW